MLFFIRFFGKVPRFPLVQFVMKDKSDFMLENGIFDAPVSPPKFSASQQEIPLQ